MSELFSPLSFRDMTLKNRTVVAPMCQYSAKHGRANEWHLVHLGRFALGGFGLVIVEATGVTPEGRISYGDMGLWNDEQIAPLKTITDFLHAQNTTAGIQLAHAGRKGSTPIAWRGSFNETEAEKAEFGFEEWTPLAPSAVPHAPGWLMPKAMDDKDLADTKAAFVAAAHRALAAGFDVIELHMAHGYLFNEFLSPLANQRTDRYGGSRENRMAYPLEIAAAVRAAWPAEKPLFVRISASDNHPDGWKPEDSVVLARELKARGIDLIDCSSGGFDGASIKPAPFYQVPFSAKVRQEADIPTMAVGLIFDAFDTEGVIERGEADLVALARGALDDPNWPLHVQHELAGDEDTYKLWPIQAAERIRSRDRSLKRNA